MTLCNVIEYFLVNFMWMIEVFVIDLSFHKDDLMSMYMLPIHMPK